MAAQDAVLPWGFIVRCRRYRAWGLVELTEIPTQIYFVQSRAMQPINPRDGTDYSTCGGTIMAIGPRR